MWFAAGVTLSTAMLFGLVPALQGATASLMTALKESATAVTATPRRARVRKALVVAQVALSLVLLVSAGLFVRTLMNAQSVDPGFSTRSGLRRRRRSAAGRLRCAARPIVLSDALARVREIQGIEAACLAGRMSLGFSGSSDTGAAIDGYTPAPNEEIIALLQPRELRLPEDTGHHARRRTGVHRSRHARAPGRHDCERDARATVLRRTRSRGRPHPRRQARTAGRGRRTRRQVQQHHGASAAVHVSADAAVVSRRRGPDRQDRRRSSVDRPTPS